MLNSNTATIIAVVKYTETFWNESALELPRNAVRAVYTAVNVEHAVAVFG